MIKKVVASILSTMLIIGAVGCADKEKDNGQNQVQQQAETVSDNKAPLEGSWAKDLSRDEAKELFGKIEGRVQEVVNSYSLEAKKVENEIKSQNDISTNDTYLEYDNGKSEANKIQTLYCGFKQYGSDLASGEIAMKILFTLDSETAKKDGGFKFEDTTMTSFSQAFLGTESRDYTELNQKINDIISGKESNKTVENNLDGVRETITVKDNVLIYKLETKEFAFK